MHEDGTIFMCGMAPAVLSTAALPATTATAAVAGTTGGGDVAPPAVATNNLIAVLNQLVTALTAVQQALAGASALGGGAPGKGTVTQSDIPVQVPVQTTPEPPAKDDTTTPPVKQLPPVKLGGGSTIQQAPTAPGTLAPGVTQVTQADGKVVQMLGGKVLKHPYERLGRTSKTTITQLTVKAGENPQRKLSEADVDWDGKGYYSRYPNVVQEYREGRWVIKSHGTTTGVHLKPAQVTPL